MPATISAQHPAMTLAARSRAWLPRREQIPSRPFWIFLSASLLFTFGFSAFFFLYNVFLLDLKLPESAIGRIAAALSLGTMMGTIPAGLCANRFGVRRVLLVAVPLAASFSLGRALLPAYTAQLVLGLLTGLTLCAWGVCLAPSVAHLTDEQTRPFAFSAIFASGIGMAGVGALVAGHLPGVLLLVSGARITPLGSHQLTLVAAAGVAALSIVPLFFLRLGPLARQPNWISRPHPFLLRFLPVAALWSFIAGAFAPFATAYFSRHLALPLGRITTIFTLSQAVQCLAVVAAPWALRRFGPGVGVLLSQLLAGCGLAALAMTRSPTHAVWIYWGYIAMSYVSEPWLYSLMMDRIPPEGRSTASSLHLLTTSIILSISAVATGSAITRYGYQPVFGALAACAATSALLFYVIARPQRSVRFGATHSSRGSEA